MTLPGPTSFAAKLVAALAVPVLLLGALMLVVTLLTTRQYMATVDQSLNRNLAARIVDQARSTPGARAADPARLAAMFSGVMALNPATEVYLLDPEGRILEHAAPLGKVTLSRVAMEPMRAFLDGAELPVYGDDPRHPDQPKVFSAAPVRDPDQLVGYLYVVLGGEAYRTVAGMLQANHLLRLSVLALLGGLTLAFAVALSSSRLLMRRLSGLVDAMTRFERSGFRTPVPAELGRDPAEGDKLDRLTGVFRALAHRIAGQLTALERVDEQRRELVMHMSHDLRTPLATLQGYLETLLIRWDRLTAAQREDYLRSSLGFSQRLERMIADLFELARLDTAEAPLRPEPFPLDELVQDVCQKLRLSAEQKGVRLFAEVDAPGRPVVADIGLIERALTNLVENAVKFTPSGGQVTVTVDETAGRLAVAVADTGMGILAGEVAHVFDRFYRVGAGSPDTAEGTGLGLAVVRRVAELHGGRADADSRLGAGSTFRLHLPAPGAGAGQPSRRSRAAAI